MYQYYLDIQIIRAEMKIITWNVCFMKKTLHEKRWPKILEICLSYTPDIILFQEVCDDFYKIIKSYEGLKDKYSIVCNSLKGSRSYYEAIIWNSKRFKAYPKNLVFKYSESERCFLNAKMTSLKTGNSIYVGTFHLDSGKGDTENRIKQLKEIDSVLDYSTPIIIGGDTNFCTDEENATELSKFLPKFKDVMTENTFDMFNNPSAEYYVGPKYFGRNVSYRLDRFGMYGISIKPKKVEVIGKEPFTSKASMSTSKASIKIHPSDHFGVFMEL